PAPARAHPHTPAPPPPPPPPAVTAAAPARVLIVCGRVGIGAASAGGSRSTASPASIRVTFRGVVQHRPVVDHESRRSGNAFALITVKIVGCSIAVVSIVRIGAGPGKRLPGASPETKPVNADRPAKS